jgi:hypothetical protein
MRDLTSEQDVKAEMGDARAHRARRGDRNDTGDVSKREPGEEARLLRQLNQTDGYGCRGCAGPARAMATVPLPSGARMARRQPANRARVRALRGRVRVLARPQLIPYAVNTLNGRVLASLQLVAEVADVHANDGATILRVR